MESSLLPINFVYAQIYLPDLRYTFTLWLPDMQFSESICIIDVDVDHYKNILDYLLGVLYGKINPIFFCNN